LKRRLECRQTCNGLRIALGISEKHSEPPHLPALLSMRRRPSSHGFAEQRDELASLHSVHHSPWSRLSLISGRFATKIPLR
jgi:hypothetical protein